MRAGRELELGRTKMLRSEPMDRPQRGAKDYGILISSWVITWMDLVSGLGTSN